MKERIEELADKVYSWCVDNDGPSYGTIQSAITDAVNEALELAAKECEKKAEYNASWAEKHIKPEHQDAAKSQSWMMIQCAAAIRKLKV